MQKAGNIAEETVDAERNARSRCSEEILKTSNNISPQPVSLLNKTVQ